MSEELTTSGLGAGVLDFFNDEENVSAAQDAMNSASSESKGSKIEVPGTYRGRVKVLISKKNDTTKVWPSFTISDKPKSKGAVQLNLVFEVVDGTSSVPKGSTTFYTLTMAQPKTASEEKIKNTASFAKPVLCTLTGAKEIQFTNAFLIEHFTVDTKEDKVIRDHKMNKEFMFVMDYSGEYLNVKNIRPPADHKDAKGNIVLERSRSAEIQISEGATADASAAVGAEIAGATTGKAMNMDFNADINPTGDDIPMDS